MKSLLLKKILSFIAVTPVFYFLCVGLRFTGDGTYGMELFTADMAFAVCAGLLAVVLPSLIERRQQLREERAAA